MRLLRSPVMVHSSGARPSIETGPLYDAFTVCQSRGQADHDAWKITRHLCLCRCTEINQASNPIAPSVFLQKSVCVALDLSFVSVLLFAIDLQEVLSTEHMQPIYTHRQIYLHKHTVRYNSLSCLERSIYLSLSRALSLSPSLPRPSPIQTPLVVGHNLLEYSELRSIFGRGTQIIFLI